MTRAVDGHAMPNAPHPRDIRLLVIGFGVAFGGCVASAVISTVIFWDHQGAVLNGELWNLAVPIAITLSFVTLWHFVVFLTLAGTEHSRLTWLARSHIVAVTSLMMLGLLSVYGNIFFVAAGLLMVAPLMLVAVIMLMAHPLRGNDIRDISDAGEVRALSVTTLVPGPRSRVLGGIAVASALVGVTAAVLPLAFHHSFRAPLTFGAFPGHYPVTAGSVRSGSLPGAPTVGSCGHATGFGAGKPVFDPKPCRDDSANYRVIEVVRAGYACVADRDRQINRGRYTLCLDLNWRADRCVGTVNNEPDIVNCSSSTAQDLRRPTSVWVGAGPDDAEWMCNDLSSSYATRRFIICLDNMDPQPS